MKKIIVEKPWGKFIQFTHNEQSTVKILEIKSGEMISLQSHQKRSEFWYVLEGHPTVILGTTKKRYKPTDSIKFKKGVKHRISNTTSKIVRVLEIATGDFDENDIVRFVDKYSRVRINKI